MAGENQNADVEKLRQELATLRQQFREMAERAGEEIERLRDELAAVKSQGARGPLVRALSERALKFKALLATAKNVRIRIARFVKARGPEGSMAQVAQPINLGAPGWRRLWTPPKDFPTVLEPGKEYEVPEPIAKALGPDVQIVGS